MDSRPPSTAYLFVLSTPGTEEDNFDDLNRPCVSLLRCRVANVIGFLS